MKIKFAAEQKKIVTVAEMPEVNKMIADMKGMDFKWEAEVAARIASRDNGNEILKIEAEIAKNNRVYDRYTDNSGNLDIWLRVYAFNSWEGFYVVGAYLSDIWESTGKNDEELRGHMYIREFIEKK